MYINKRETYLMIASTMDRRIRRIRSKKQYQWKLGHPLKIMLSSVKARAKASGKEFDLTLEWLSSKGNICELTGLSLSVDDDRNPLTLSIDRINSKQGYTMTNCRVICLALNFSFNDWGSEAFEPIAKAFVKRLANA